MPQLIQAFLTCMIIMATCDESGNVFAMLRKRKIRNKPQQEYTRLHSSRIAWMPSMPDSVCVSDPKVALRVDPFNGCTHRPVYVARADTHSFGRECTGMVDKSAFTVTKVRC